MSSIYLKRLQKEYENFIKDPSDNYIAYPIKDDLFCWHFTIKGPEESEFEGGIYHGIIKLPMTYPYKPPSIMFLTPNGRFDINVDVCLSITKYHEEEWQSAWTIRSMLEAIIAFMPIKENHSSIGALDYPKEIRKEYAEKSKKFICKECGPIINLLPKTEIKKNKILNEKINSDIKENPNDKDKKIIVKNVKKIVVVKKISENLKDLNKSNTINNNNNIKELKENKNKFISSKTINNESFPSINIFTKINKMDNSNNKENKIKNSTFNSDFKDEYDYYKAQNSVICYFNKTNNEIEKELNNKNEHFFDNEDFDDLSYNENIKEINQNQYEDNQFLSSDYSDDINNNEQNKTYEINKKLNEMYQKNIENCLKKKITMIKYYSRETYKRVKKEKINKFNFTMAIILIITVCILRILQLLFI